MHAVSSAHQSPPVSRLQESTKPAPRLVPQGNQDSLPLLLRVRRHGILVLALLFGVLISAVGVVLDLAMLDQHESRSVVIEASDIFTGLVGGALAYGALHIARERQRMLQRRLNVISTFNDQIRNSLQMISLTAHAMPEKQAVAVIDGAVKRIEQALREASPNF